MATPKLALAPKPGPKSAEAEIQMKIRAGIRTRRRAKREGSLGTMVWISAIILVIAFIYRVMQ